MSASPDFRFEIRRLLSLQRWYQELAAADRHMIEGRAYTTAAPKGQWILSSDRVGEAWFAVLRGVVTLQTPGCHAGGAFIALPCGEWFGAGCAFTGERGRYGVTALRNSVLLCVPRAEFLRLLDLSFTFNRAVLQQMDRSLKQSFEIIRCARSESVEHKLALYLGSSFWNALQHFNLSQEELATLCGASRQTVNRALKRLAALGMVQIEHGRVVGANTDALMAHGRGDEAAPPEMPGAQSRIRA